MQAFYLNDSKSNLLKEHRKTKATQPSKLPGQRTKRRALIFNNKIQEQKILNFFAIISLYPHNKTKSLQ